MILPKTKLEVVSFSRDLKFVVGKIVGGVRKKDKKSVYYLEVVYLLEGGTEFCELRENIYISPEFLSKQDFFPADVVDIPEACPVIQRFENVLSCLENKPSESCGELYFDVPTNNRIIQNLVSQIIVSCVDDLHCNKLKVQSAKAEFCPSSADENS